MPVTVAGTTDRELELQTDNPQNGEEREVVEERQQQQQQHIGSDPVEREITQTDRLNKRLLESLLSRLNKSIGEFDKFLDKTEEDENSDNSDEEPVF